VSEHLGLRVELFPADIDRFVDFYVRVLRFELTADRRHEQPPYVSVSRGGVRIGALRAWQEVDPQLRSLPQGVELVIEVEDLVTERDAVLRSGADLSEDITARPWGLEDFRLFDPDGYYLRFTTLR
jgi:predicted enzyme related to lactoylglutathione lyase